MSYRLSTWVLLWVVACGGPPRRTLPQAEPAGLVDIGPDLAPVPFAPGTLARTFHPGALVTYRVATAGKPDMFATTEFVATSASGATMRDTTTRLDGTPLGAPKTVTSTWKELEAHAHFPRAGTTITEETIEVPAGRYDCVKYELTRTKDGVDTTTRVWFARKLPGPPVKLVREVGGHAVYTMSLARTVRP